MTSEPGHCARHDSLLSELALRLGEIDGKIDKARTQFYSEVLRKKREVRRTWLQVNLVANEHQLQTLPLRTPLREVDDKDEKDKGCLTEEEDVDDDSLMSLGPDENHVTNCDLFTDYCDTSSSGIGLHEDYEDEDEDTNNNMPVSESIGEGSCNTSKTEMTEGEGWEDLDVDLEIESIMSQMEGKG